MIPAQDRGEYQEKEEKHDKDHEYSLYVVPLASLYVDCDIRVVNDGLGMCSEGKVQGRDLRNGLEQ